MNERYEEYVFREGFRRGYEKGKADRPRGEWKLRYIEPEELGGTLARKRLYCSACGNWQTYGETNYCPNCGADMRGEDDAQQ